MKPLGSYAGARIVFTNWRDLRNPSAGGAEVYASASPSCSRRPARRWSC